ncbi:hypothetical protein [Hyalangium rubrum]|uniref:Lipoprotein n=1 Tax=Hyalangium rubrum TaxID=3103134 RepID=A0ABU5HCQ8_9BACT|nr:hypothetical protein [Hyalangium sp. s54d21]MDY7231248.1 hypothetical protein [Hyalangium sp. s54d21]
MLRLRLIAALLLAAPALAAPPKSGGTAPASKPAAAAAGETCSTCGTSGEGGTCSADQAGKGPSELTDEEWSEYVRKKIAESEAPKPEPVDPDPFAFSLYQGRRPEFMGEQTIINGAKMKIASLIVPDPPHVVAQEYYEVFEKMGFRPLVGEIPNTRGVRYLSFRPTGSNNLKTVTLVPNGSGTVILASVGNPEDMLLKKPDLPDGVPVPPQAEAASVIQQTEPGASSRSAFFLVRGTSPASVREFYRQEMKQRGFNLVAQPQEGQDTESFEKGELMMSVTARPHSEPGSVAVNLVWLQ